MQMAEIPPQITGRKVSFDGDPDGAFSISEFCLAYKLSRSAVYKQISARRLRTMKVGARTLISRRAARDWETLCEISGGQQPATDTR
jgi:hypothetical protein